MTTEAMQELISSINKLNRQIDCIDEFILSDEFGKLTTAEVIFIKKYKVAMENNETELKKLLTLIKSSKKECAKKLKKSTPNAKKADNFIFNPKKMKVVPL